MARVLLVNMPFFHLRWPSLALGLLKASLGRRGIACDAAYLNFDFAERIGLDAYTWIAEQFAFVLGGERLFAREYFGPQLPTAEDYWRNVLLPADAKLSGQDRQEFERLFDQVEPFLDGCMASIDWQQYDVVGFAASFQQTLPSLCLARRIKQQRPQTTVLLGGAACAGPMGVELLRQFPQIDYVFLGEADLTFPPLVEELLVGRRPELPPGVVGRESVAPLGEELRPTLEPRPLLVHDLDGLPYPDFDDYFARLRASPLQAAIEPLLFFETSRGCWWGQKHHCLFCGLNGAALAYRSKSPRRAVEELRHLVERYGVTRANSSDNILDPRYFETLLPMLQQTGLALRFVYEMRTNLTRGQVDALLRAGLGAAQLGIETFSTPLLRQIGKGTTALQNLQVLKWFSQAGIEVKWNLLYGFPGEDPAEYAALAELLPSLYHLAPPLAVGRVRLDRFSPYFEAPQEHGMVHVRPHRAFRGVYPFADDVLERIAYYFEFDYADGRDPLDYAAPLVAAAEAWQQLSGTVTLRCWDRPEGVLILTDTRPCARQFQWRLAGLERAVYLYCDTGRPWPAILEYVRQMAAAGDPPADPVRLRQVLSDWVDARIMVQTDGCYLSLALRAASD